MIRLYVQYTQKEEVKRFGARWNPTGKFWYYDGDVLPPELKRWSRPGVLPTEREVTAPAEREMTALPSGTDWLKGYLTVSEASEVIKDQYHENPAFRNLMIVGEVTDFTGVSRGHYYFDIKDRSAMLPCVMFAGVAGTVLRFPLRNGIQVAITGFLDLYQKGGKTNIVVTDIRGAGEGEAALALLKLQRRLEAEGLFDAKYKKTLPKYPKRVGILTSRNGKAIGDILKTAANRNPYIQLLLYDVNVQGQYAVKSILEGIRVLNRMQVDVIIVGRGGGSDEELSAYNDEQVVRAVFQSVVPIVAAVGHEGNWTLTDHAADLRASNPTDAAVKTIPDVMTDRNRLIQLRQSLKVLMEHQLQRRRMLLETRQTRLQALDPAVILKGKKERLQMLVQQLDRSILKALEDRKHRCEVLITQLHGLSPTSKLVNGFGYISREDRPVTSISQVREGDEIHVRICDGQIHAQVTGISG